MASTMARDPTARTFIPRSRVLLERRPVSFESDDEDAPSPLPTLQPPVLTPVEQDSTEGTEVAFIRNGCVESERFDLSAADLATAIESLPRDAWTTLLDDNDRRRLATYLPQLDGWNGMANEDAQRMAVEALLERENLHIGNPLATLAQSVRDGSCTVPATIARETYKKQAMARFALERDTILAENRKKSKKNESPGDDSTPQWKKIRLSNTLPFIHSRNPTDGPSNRSVLIFEDDSVFLGIRTILAHLKLNMYELMGKLRSEYPRQCASMEQDVPPFLTFDKYVEAALVFLSGDYVEPTDPESSQWSNAVFVKFDPELKQYEWCSQGDTMEIKNLLLLEQVFRAPVPNGFLNFSDNSSGAKATRKRRDRIIRERARDALLASDKSFSVLDGFRASRPSLLLKQALLEQGASTVSNGKKNEQSS